MTRYPNILFIVYPIFLCLKKKKMLELVTVFLGFIIGFSPEVFANLSQGSVFSAHYSDIYNLGSKYNVELFGINNFLRHFPVLFMIYLFPFLIMIFHFRFKTEVREIYVFLFIWSLVGILFYSFYYFCDTPWYDALAMTSSRRFLLPIIPSNCIMVGIAISRFFKWLNSLWS